MQYNKWIEVDTEAVKHNLNQVQSLLEEQVRLIAVVKNNAYGHGAVEVARLLFQNGVDFFAVSYLKEALELREGGIRASIMLFTPLASDEEYQEAVKNHFTVTIASLRDWEKIRYISARLRAKVRVHLKIETGLGRFGLNMEDALRVAEQGITDEYIHIEGVYTHMAQGTVEKYTEQQYEQFLSTVSALEEAGCHIGLKHCANSVVFLKYPHMHMNAVRIGTLLSGQYPVGKMPRPIELHDPYQFKCRVIAVNHVSKGSYLGYNSTYRMKKDGQVAVIPVGYSDGLALEVGNPPSGFNDMLKLLIKGVMRYLNMSRVDLMVHYGGREYPVRGKVFMQMALVEMPTNVYIKVGDEVQVPVKKTIASRDEVRLYTIKGEPVKKADPGGITYLTERD